VAIPHGYPDLESVSRASHAEWPRHRDGLSGRLQVPDKRAYKADHAGVYADLDEQPTVQELLGTASMVFTNTERDVPKTGKILGADGITTLAQGEGLSSIALLQNKVDTLSPAEHLALTTATSTPGDTCTYPDQETWVWLAGIDREHVANVNTYSVGLLLHWGAPQGSSSSGRVRSVVG
jgi:hypothetical protein